MRYRRNSDDDVQRARQFLRGHDVQRAKQVLRRHGFYAEAGDLPKTRETLQEWVEHIDLNVEAVDRATDYIGLYIEQSGAESGAEPLDVLLELRARISELRSDVPVVSSILISLARDTEERPLSSVRRWKKWRREHTATLVGRSDDSYEGSPLSIVANAIRELTQ